MKKIMVIGDVMLDKYSFGKITRLNPEESGAPLVNMPQEDEFRLGGAANVAANIKSLNREVELIGILGNDPQGVELSKLCESFGIALTSLLSDEPTMMKRRVMVGARQVIRLDFGEKMSLSDLQKQEIIDHISQQNSDYLLFSDYAKGIADRELVQEIKKLSRDKKFNILADIKPKNLEKFNDIYLIKPNFKEFCEMIGGDIQKEDEAGIEKYGVELAQKLNTNLVVTKSELGATLITKNGEVQHISTHAKQVIDVSGAGDSFLAGLTVGLSEGMSLSDAVHFGNRVSGVAVGKVGTAIVTREELEVK